MTEFLVEQAKRLKNDGQNFSQIKTYLKTKGSSEDEIKSIFQIIDNDEFHILTRKHKQQIVLSELIGSLTLILTSIIFNIYRFGSEEGISILTIVIPMSIFMIYFNKYIRTRKTKYTVSSIMRKSLRDRWHK